MSSNELAWGSYGPLLIKALDQRSRLLMEHKSNNVFLSRGVFFSIEILNL